MSLTLVPIDWTTARGFVADWHRHNAPPVGWRFGTGAATDDGVLRGVVVVGRPVARRFDDGATLEVTRCTTDGTRNACRPDGCASADEPGASLRAAGWQVIAERPARDRPGRGWDAPSRRRGSDYDAIPRALWEAVL